MVGTSNLGSWNGHWKVRQADDATMHWTSESRLRQLHASCLSATRELLHAFRAHHWLHSVGVTKWLILILLRWWTRQTVLDVKVWWPQYTIDNLILRLPDSMLKPVQLVVAQAFFCLKKGVWRRCMACISSFLRHFPMSFTWVRGHSWAFRNGPVIEKIWKNVFDPSSIVPFGSFWYSNMDMGKQHCEKGEASM